MKLMTPTATRETRLRRQARRWGLEFGKHRVRDPRHPEHGKYYVIEPRGQRHEKLSLDQAEKFIAETYPAVVEAELSGPSRAWGVSAYFMIYAPATATDEEVTEAAAVLLEGGQLPLGWMVDDVQVEDVSGDRLEGED
jgi:hypothetical protein